ncbi:MAG: chorismate mutase [Firmicutes bacterium]|nr:chorismate mutase [Bacillota bacterium]
MTADPRRHDNDDKKVIAMDLQDYRKQINEIDDQMLELFEQRMKVAADIGLYKQMHGLQVLDAAREEQKLKDVSGKLPEDLKDYGQKLYKLLMELSREYQNGRTTQC